jgi:cation/acetate symporter
MAGLFGDDGGGVSNAAANKAFKQNLNKIYKWYVGGFVAFVVVLAVRWSRWA